MDLVDCNVKDLYCSAFFNGFLNFVLNPLIEGHFYKLFSCGFHFKDIISKIENTFSKKGRNFNHTHSHTQHEKEKTVNLIILFSSKVSN